MIVLSPPDWGESYLPKKRSYIIIGLAIFILAMVQI